MTIPILQRSRTTVSSFTARRSKVCRTRRLHPSTAHRGHLHPRDGAGQSDYVPRPAAAECRHRGRLRARQQHGADDRHRAGDPDPDLAAHVAAGTAPRTCRGSRRTKCGASILRGKSAGLHLALACIRARTCGRPVACTGRGLSVANWVEVVFVSVALAAMLLVGLPDAIWGYLHHVAWACRNKARSTAHEKCGSHRGIDRILLAGSAAASDDTCSAVTGDVAIAARTPEVDLYDGPMGKRVQTMDGGKFPGCTPIVGRSPNMMLQVSSTARNTGCRRTW